MRGIAYIFYFVIYIYSINTNSRTQTTPYKRDGDTNTEVSSQHLTCPGAALPRIFFHNSVVPPSLKTTATVNSGGK